MITILGPTATGKTRIAVILAEKVNAEIISADSRQVYRNMDIGTGKDLNEYQINGKDIPFHLINIVDAGYKYNVHEYVRDFEKAYNHITSNNKNVVFCGGSGMYLEAILKGYKLETVPPNALLREELKNTSYDELVKKLSSLRKTHNTTDFTDNERLIRAIEIEVYYKQNNICTAKSNAYKSLIFGIDYPRDEIRKRITFRLKQRLDNGMLDEVKLLLENGVDAEQLMYYGLEYKFITQYICGELSYNKMFDLLNTAIHQFAKRQMTWFRRMQKQGLSIIWLDGFLDDEEKVNLILQHRKQ